MDKWFHIILWGLVVPVLIGIAAGIFLGIFWPSLLFGTHQSVMTDVIIWLLLAVTGIVVAILFVYKLLRFLLKKTPQTSDVSG